jgi:hypothetical protein
VFKSFRFLAWLRSWVIAGLAILLPAIKAKSEDINWVENFADDPVVVGRFEIPAGHDAGRFEYDGGGPLLTIHYNSSEPTAWYLRPIDANQPRTLGRCEDFEFTVTFRIRSTGFVADPDSFAQLGWGLINSQTTGEDRAGGSLNGPYAFDTATFDFFPNVSTLFGGPTLGTTITHSDDGNGFFSSFDFPFGPESDIKAAFGDVPPALDTVYMAGVSYDAGAQTATLTLHETSGFLAINTDGGGGPGGPDSDAATIQTTLFVESPFALDTFALTAWVDTFDFDPLTPSVVADVDVMEIEFFARTLIKGDMNRDGRVDGLDIGPFVDTLLSAQPTPCAVQRADFTDDDFATTDDIVDFEAALLAP